MFAVVEVINERYVLVCDGDVRPIENPKTKNIRHLQWTNTKAEDVVSSLIRGEMPDNHIIRKNLKRIQERGEGGLVNG
ncbi:MAG: RNA-binding protein [Syntrophomonas sp.]